MQNRIAEHIVTILSPVIVPSYMYDQQHGLPYCVYEIDQMEPRMAKSGPIGYNATVSIYLAASSEGESEKLKDKVLAVLGKRVDGFVINVNAVQPAFAEEQWLQKIDINVKQL